MTVAAAVLMGLAVRVRWPDGRSWVRSRLDGVPPRVSVGGLLACGVAVAAVVMPWVPRPSGPGVVVAATIAAMLLATVPPAYAGDGHGKAAKNRTAKSSTTSVHRSRGADGAAGPVRRRLDGGLDARGQPPVERPVGTLDDDYALRARPAGGGDGPVDHRAPAEVVQHLGGGRAHAGPLPGGHDDDGGGGHGAGG